MIKYYVVLPLPLNVLLIFYQAFSDKEDAAQLILSKLSWFSIWDSEQVNAWHGRKIYIPFRDAKKKESIYFIQIKTFIKTTEPYSQVEADLRWALSGLKMKGIDIKLTKEHSYIEPLDKGAPGTPGSGVE